MTFEFFKAFVDFFRFDFLFGYKVSQFEARLDERKCRAENLGLSCAAAKFGGFFG